MDGNQHDDTPLLDNWVDRTLGFTPEQSPKEKQREILKRLQDVQFHPGFYEASAIQAYYDQELSSVAKWQSCARLLRDQIAEFRSQFFQLDVESRKARFEKLHTDAEYFPVLKLQLSKLKSGLELTKEPVNELGEGASQLLRFLMNNHVEEPSQKPARRREFQALNTHRTSDWKRFVTELKQHAPAVAALDSRWLQQLSHPAKSRN